MECFQEFGISDRVRQELMMWRMTSPIAGKPAFSMRMHTPSAPQAAEFRMLKTVCPSTSRVTGDSTNEQAPTRGRRVLVAVTGPCAPISAATRGPTETKNSFSWSAVASGRTGVPSLFPAMTVLIQCHTLAGPRSPISLCISRRRSPRTAERTARFSCLYSAESRPECASAARRRAMTSRVAAVTGGAVGLRIGSFSAGHERQRSVKSESKIQSTVHPQSAQQKHPPSRHNKGHG